MYMYSEKILDIENKMRNLHYSVCSFMNIQWMKICQIPTNRFKKTATITTTKK